MESDKAASFRGVEAVLARMRVLGGELPPHDGVAVFNRVYQSVTEEVLRRLRAGRFERSAVAADLDVRFASRYLAAVDADAAGERAPACWRPLFRARRHPGVRALQFAMAGINAHIGHDLALAVVDTCRGLGIEPDSLEDDFHRVGAVLTDLEEQIREDLMPGPDLLDIADPLTHLVDSWSLERARDAAWTAARALWRLRELTDVCEEFADGLDRGVGLVSRFLLIPLDVAWHGRPGGAVVQPRRSSTIGSESEPRCSGGWGCPEERGTHPAVAEPRRSSTIGTQPNTTQV